MFTTFEQEHDRLFLGQLSDKGNLILDIVRDLQEQRGRPQQLLDRVDVQLRRQEQAVDSLARECARQMEAVVDREQLTAHGVVVGPEWCRL